MLRVTDLDRSIDFYTEILGMTLLERREHKKNQFSQAYLGYGAGFDGMTIELVFKTGSARSLMSPATPSATSPSSEKHHASLRPAGGSGRARCRARRAHKDTAKASSPSSTIPTATGSNWFKRRRPKRRPKLKKFGFGAIA